MNAEEHTVWLAALLHDIGKFWQRAGREGTHTDAGADCVDQLSGLIPSSWFDEIRHAVADHHLPAVNTRITKIVQVADRLASQEQAVQEHGERVPAETPLLPVSSQVEFRTVKPAADWQVWGYDLNALALERQVIFPTTAPSISAATYARMWKAFMSELPRLTHIDTYLGFTSLLALLRKYTSFMPATTPTENDEPNQTSPDVSLYDHLKVTCAIAACLARLEPDHLEVLLRQGGATPQPVVRLLRADLSGIQNYLYRIARAERTAEFRGTAKRLRGRSFYLTLLEDLTADWLLRELGLSPANLLFRGGGNFVLLIGADQKTETKLHELEAILQRWFLSAFYGELGIQLATVELVPEDFKDLGSAFTRLEAGLARVKQQKFRSDLNDEAFFVREDPLIEVCNYCRVTPNPEEEPCLDCAHQRRIGGKLPRTTDYLAYLYGSAQNLHLPKDAVSVDFAKPFGLQVVLLSEEEASKLAESAGHGNEVIFHRLNSTDFLPKKAPAHVTFGFKFFGDAAPTWIDPSPGKDEKTKPGDVLDYEETASMSTGARLLGVLKADVDYLGQVFMLGLEPQSIARLATLSSALELFFAGWLNRICDDLAHAWHHNAENDNYLQGKVDGLFHIVYSGGDDLLILGPWDSTVELSHRIYKDFRAFTCHNGNLTLSAGIVLVKPLFPIQRFAQLAGEQLERSKTASTSRVNEKDRITVFSETVRWERDEKGFDDLYNFAQVVARYVEDNRLPRSFIYFLLRLYETHFDQEGGQSLMWLPDLHYMLARRVRREILEDRDLDLAQSVVRLMPKIRIPMNYVSLKIRRV